VRILEVKVNNRKKSFEVRTSDARYPFPFAKLVRGPSAQDRVVEVFADEEAGGEAFTFRLESGIEDTVHLDAVLEYNEDPAVLNELLLHRLTIEARLAVEASKLSKREMIRCLGTSASQFYRLLDPANYGKSIGQMLALLRILGREVELVVRPTQQGTGS
jgi:hypothetical protein